MSVSAAAIICGNDVDLRTVVLTYQGCKHGMYGLMLENAVM